MINLNFEKFNNAIRTEENSIFFSTIRNENSLELVIVNNINDEVTTHSTPVDISFKTSVQLSQNIKYNYIRALDSTSRAKIEFVHEIYSHLDVVGYECDKIEHN